MKEVNDMYQQIIERVAKMENPVPEDFVSLEELEVPAFLRVK